MFLATVTLNQSIYSRLCKYCDLDRQLPLSCRHPGRGRLHCQGPTWQGPYLHQEVLQSDDQDSTSCDVPSGVCGQCPQGCRLPLRQQGNQGREKFCCRAVRRKRKMAAESRQLLTPSSCLISPHLPVPSSVPGEDHGDSGVTTGLVSGVVPSQDLGERSLFSCWRPLPHT